MKKLKNFIYSALKDSSENNSMTLSNLPKNLVLTLSWLIGAGKKTTLLIGSCFFYLIKTANAEATCGLLIDSKISQVYLSHPVNNAHLFLQHNKGTTLTTALNNTCGFIISDQKADFYKWLGCFCREHNQYGVILSGQNVEIELLKCIENFLENFCSALNEINPTDPSFLTATALVCCFMIIVCCIVVWPYPCPDFNAIYSHVTTRFSGCCNGISDCCTSLIYNCKEAFFSLNRRREEKLIDRQEMTNIVISQNYDSILR